MHRLLATINVLFAVSVLAWPLAVFFAIFLFDSPGSKKDPILLAFAASILAYPASVALGNVMFWTKRNVATIRSLRNWTLVSSTGPVATALLGALNFSR